MIIKIMLIAKQMQLIIKTNPIKTNINKIILIIIYKLVIYIKKKKIMK